MTAIGWSARIRRHAPALAGLAIFFAFVAPVLAPGVQLYYRDTGRLYYPVKLYIAQALAHGRIAWWDSMTEAGLSLLGQVTPGLLHPFTLLYAVLPFDLAFKLNHLAGLLLGGIGAWRLARRLGASPWAALAGAVAYGGSGYLVSMADSNLPYALGAGSVPIATATSMRPSRTFVRTVCGMEAASAAGAIPPDVCAMMLTASVEAARRRSRRCSAAFFWRCQCIPVVWPS